MLHTQAHKHTQKHIGLAVIPSWPHISKRTNKRVSMCEILLRNTGYGPLLIRTTALKTQQCSLSLQTINKSPSLWRLWYTSCKYILHLFDASSMRISLRLRKVCMHAQGAIPCITSRKVCAKRRLKTMWAGSQITPICMMQRLFCTTTSLYAPIVSVESKPTDKERT